MQFHNFIIELQYQYLNYITGIPVLYKVLKKIHNTGTNFYTSDRQVQEIRQGWFMYGPIWAMVEGPPTYMPCCNLIV